jgi:hypothetical protein
VFLPTDMEPKNKLAWNNADGLTGALEDKIDQLANIHPRPPAVRVFDAGVGDGTVLARVARPFLRSGLKNSRWMNGVRQRCSLRAHWSKTPFGGFFSIIVAKTRNRMAASWLAVIRQRDGTSECNARSNYDIGREHKCLNPHCTPRGYCPNHPQCRSFRTY